MLSTVCLLLQKSVFLDAITPIKQSNTSQESHISINFDFRKGLLTYHFVKYLNQFYSQAINDLGRAFEQNNITVKISQSFRRYDDVGDNLAEIQVGINPLSVKPVLRMLIS